MACRHLTTHVWRPVSASRHRDGDRQARVHSASVRHECQCATGDEVVSGLPSVSVIESNTAAVAERKAGCRTIDNQEYDV